MKSTELPIAIRKDVRLRQIGHGYPPPHLFEKGTLVLVDLKHWISWWRRALMAIGLRRFERYTVERTWKFVPKQNDDDRDESAVRNQATGASAAAET
jgi:hypothetical protein